MDCVRTAIRQDRGQREIAFIAADKANMPGSQREVGQLPRKKALNFVWLSAPKAFTGGEVVEGVMVDKMRLGAPDQTGRQSPEIIEGAEYVEGADMVIKALGFEPEDLPTLWGVPELEVTRWGTIKANFRTHETADRECLCRGRYRAGCEPRRLGDP